MDSLDKEIEKILGPKGLLAKSLEGFEPRHSQLEMARLIAKALECQMNAVVEAGTGTGKTLGYLVPILLSGKKAVISTGTKNLQEQIYHKDIPLLAEATGMHPDAMMMKGRKNYLCLHRYHQAFLQPSMIVDNRERVRKKLEAWIGNTEFADRSELSWMQEDDLLWDSLSCSSDQCLGSECLHFDECFLNKLKRRAAEARLIIVNHHLFFADLKVKQSGFGEIIPRFQVALFDEAHDVEETAVSYFGESLGTRQLMEFAADVEKEASVLGKKQQTALKTSLDHVRAGAEQLRAAFQGREEKGRIEQELLALLHETVGRKVMNGLQTIAQRLEEEKGVSLAFQGLVLRAEALTEKINEIMRKRDDNWLIWYEQRKRTLSIHVSPLDISQQMQKHLFHRIRTVIFTSATISTNGNFDYIRARLGFDEYALEGLYPSHFDFANQALMYIPKDLPLPMEPGFAAAAAQRISAILQRSSGRALVLFTSHQNMNMVYETLMDTVPFTLYKQGDAPRSDLLNAFRQDVHSVLLATGAFWQGVDVPGESLSCLIVDKLPFDSPGEPLVAARIKAIKVKGGNPFLDYQVPSAIISLRQGLGRLIRKKTDKGVMAILDKRILTTRYGKLFLQSLPPIPITHQLKDIEVFFEGAISL